MKNKNFIFIAMFLLTLILAGCGQEASNTEQNQKDTSTNQNPNQNSSNSTENQFPTLTWQIGYNTGEGTVRDIAAKKFAEIVTEKTNGSVTFEFFPDEILGSEAEMAEQVQMGAIQMQVIGGGIMGNSIPEFGISVLPFLFQDYEEAYALLDGPVGQKWATLAEDHKVKVLSHIDSGFAHITTNEKPINHPDDFIGLTMRAPNGPQYIEPFKVMGASVSTLPYGEVYMALNQGVVDGQFNPLDPIYATKFHEVQDYLALTNILYYHNKLIVNKDLWDGLDPKLQEIMMGAAEEAKLVSREFVQEREAEMLETLKPHFKEITKPDLGPFREKMAPLYEDQFLELFGEEAVKEAIQFLEEYRAKNS